MKTFWPTAAADPTATDLIANRHRFVQQYNLAMGEPSQQDAEFQAQFIAGQITYDEMVSYVRLCKYKIDAVSTKLG